MPLVDTTATRTGPGFGAIAAIVVAAVAAAEVVSAGNSQDHTGAGIRSTAQDDVPGRRVAVTFDDLPLGGPQLGIERMAAMTRKLVGAIAAAEVPAVGFVNEGKIDVEGEVEERLAILRMWTDAGLELGNHTYSHPSPHHVPLPEFFDDIVRGEPMTRALMAESGGELRYFRHPFLRRGLTLDDKESIDSFLAGRGYTVAPVTMDNVDYLFSAVYTDAKTAGDRTLMAAIADAYLEFSARIYEFYEDAALKLFDRPIAHVYLLHANELNADTFERFVELTRDRGYELVTLEQAISDPAYASADRYAGPAGTSWLFRWDATQTQQSGSRRVDWRAEPAVPAWVQELFEQRPAEVSPIVRPAARE